jgi:imidazolonepropionase-like amidohydrolase
MARSCLFACVAVAMIASAAAPIRAAEQQRYTFMSNGEKVGHLHATLDGERVAVDFRIDENGRGPKIRESLRLGADGLPVEWLIEGTASFGAPVKEELTVRGATVRWKSTNDSGSGTLRGPKLYLANDASPWVYGPWLRALLADPDRQLDALPGGVLRVEPLKDLEIGSDDGAQQVTAYALWGEATRPGLALLRPDRSLFAWMASGAIMLPEGRESDFEALSALEQALHHEYLVRLTREHLHRFEQVVQVRNVRVLDTERAVLGEPATVVVFRGRIASIRADEPPIEGAVVIDGEGGTLMPALTDVHVHLGPWAAPSHLAAGVTTVRDMGNENSRLLELIASLDSGEIMGPRVLSNGFIEGRTQFSASGGFVVDELPAALEKVRWYADHGYRGIKIYNSMPPDWVVPIATEAHRLGLRVMGHVPAFSSAERAVRDGYDEITHINQLMLSFVIDTAKEDTRTPFRFTALGERVGRLDLASEPVRRMVKLMKERNIAIDPTVATFGPLLLGRPGKVAETDEPWLSHMPVPVQRSRKAPFLDMKPGDDARYRASWNKMLEMLRLLDAEGIQILPGTDGPPGVLLHSELETYVKAGISNARVLRIATLGTARYLGLDQELGSVAPGKRADFIVIDGDPLREIGAIRRIRMVMHDGAVLFPEDFHRAVGIKPFASKLTVKPAVDSPQSAAR